MLDFDQTGYEKLIKYCITLHNYTGLRLLDSMCIDLIFAMADW